MEKRIPIDELFHEKLYEGKEQMNLGAWANMERLLDGKNPYAEEDKKRKRRFLPFLLMALLTTCIVGAGYLVKTKKSKDKAKTETTQVAENQHAFTSSPSGNIQQQTPTAATQLVNDNIETSSKNLNESENLQNTTQSTSVAHKPSMEKKQNTPNNTSASSEEPKDLAQIPKMKNAETAKSTPLTQNKVSSKTGDGINQKQVHETTNKNENPALTNSIVKNDELKNNETSFEHNNPGTIDNNAASEIKEQENTSIEKIPVVALNRKEVKNRDGSIKYTTDDTIGQSVYEKRTVTSSTDQNLASSGISNPRFKHLSPEEELNAQLKNEVSTQNEVIKTEMTTAPAIVPSSVEKSEAHQVAKKHQTSFIQDLGNFTRNTYQKINNFMVYGVKPNLYTGMSMGVNTSLNSKKNNFGGFQAGLNAFYPLSRSITLMTELKFFFRNNGGFTVNGEDIKLQDHSQDNVTLAGQGKTIYTYTIDSTSTTYNFKTFKSLELPILFQYNYRSITAYGGLNLAFGFKPKLEEKIKRQPQPTVHDTVDANLAYSFPANKSSLYKREDFRSRFGIGYSIGAAYSFSPNLYIDLRITQNVWDNMKTLAAKEISNGYFKVPSVQLSLGYRFKKYSPED